MELITKAYDMDYSDSRLKQLETILKSLSEEPEEASTQKDEPITPEFIKSIFNTKPQENA